MTRLVSDSVVISATPSTIRTMLHDPQVLERVLPGCESLVETAPDTYEAVLAVRIQFMRIRADVSAAIEDPGDGAVRLTMRGKPRGLVGAFDVDVPFRLEPEGTGTRVTYDVDLDVSGRLAAFGALILRDTTKRQIAELVRNVEREAGA